MLCTEPLDKSIDFRIHSRKYLIPFLSFGDVGGLVPFYLVLYHLGVLSKRISHKSASHFAGRLCKHHCRHT